MLTLFKHLLPRSKAWNLAINRLYRRFFESLSPPIIDDAKDFVDLTYFDFFPADTREINAWESAFGILDSGLLTEAERRVRLAGLWAAQGGQNPKYIQDTLQDNGFDVYIHEWWVPGSSPAVARDPGTVTNLNYMLVNKIYNAEIDYTVLCGEPLAACGEPTAECGENDGILFNRVQYPIPTDPAEFPYILYIGGQTFGDVAYISSNRIDELENLLLKICPTQQWIGMIVEVYNPIIEDLSGDPVVEDFSGSFALEG